MEFSLKLNKCRVNYFHFFHSPTSAQGRHVHAHPGDRCLPEVWRFLRLVLRPVCIFSLTDASTEENKVETAHRGWFDLQSFVSFLLAGQCAEHQATVLLGIMRDSFIPMQPGIVVMVAAHMMFNGKLASNFNLSIQLHLKVPFFSPLNWV